MARALTELENHATQRAHDNSVRLQHTATRCNTLQHTATRCNTPQLAATHCNTLQHIATHCDTLRHAATRCDADAPLSKASLLPHRPATTAHPQAFDCYVALFYIAFGRQAGGLPPATLCDRGCHPQPYAIGPALPPYATKAATACNRGCHRLQPNRGCHLE